MENWKAGKNINGCPSHTAEPYEKSSSYSLRYFSYGVSYAVCQYYGSYDPIQRSKVNNPAHTIWIIDMTNDVSADGWGFYGFGADFDRIGYMHGGAANALFVDGRVAPLRIIDAATHTSP